MKKLRVFRENIDWMSDQTFLLDTSITFNELKDNIHTALLEKKMYKGIMDFDEKFLEILSKSTINGKKYYYFENNAKKY